MRNIKMMKWAGLVMLTMMGAFAAPADAGGNAGATCGTRGGAICTDGLYCKREPAANCGRADAPGRCAVKPQMCTRGYRPVCGCDGRTYSNACTAGASGASVDHAGACPGRVGSTCGTRGAGACAAGLYCEFPAAAVCGALDHGGVCKAKPTACAKNLAPVCGCNNVTYGNLCEARRAGVSVKSSGRCAGAEGSTCGTRGAARCGEGLYCQFSDAAMCGAADHGGTCQSSAPRPCTRDYRPVCACNGRTYSNRCVAYSSSQSVKSQGACPGTTR